MKFALVAILLAACSKAPAEHHQPSAAAQPAPAMAEDKIGMPGSQDLAPLANLPNQLHSEAGARP
ncbi:MAG TPA: hypothetical protein VGC41_11940, partial [Kofleriaceae bacterium]